MNPSRQRWNSVPENCHYGDWANRHPKFIDSRHRHSQPLSKAWPSHEPTPPPFARLPVTMVTELAGTLKFNASQDQYPRPLSLAWLCHEPTPPRNVEVTCHYGDWANWHSKFNASQDRYSWPLSLAWLCHEPIPPRNVQVTRHYGDWVNWHSKFNASQDQYSRPLSLAWLCHKPMPPRNVEITCHYGDWANRHSKLNDSWHRCSRLLKQNSKAGRPSLGLSPHSTSATVGLLYQPRMMDDDYGAVGGMRIGRGNRSTWRKPDPVPLCPPHPTWPDLGSNPGHHGGKPAINRLSYGTTNSPSLLYPSRQCRERSLFQFSFHSNVYEANLHYRALRSFTSKRTPI
jgi:hypothetical protein